MEKVNKSLVKTIAKVLNKYYNADAMVVEYGNTYSIEMENEVAEDILDNELHQVLCTHQFMIESTTLVTIYKN